MVNKGQADKGRGLLQSTAFAVSLPTLLLMMTGCAGLQPVTGNRDFEEGGSLCVGSGSCPNAAIADSGELPSSKSQSHARPSAWVYPDYVTVVGLDYFSAAGPQDSTDTREVCFWHRWWRLWTGRGN